MNAPNLLGKWTSHYTYHEGDSSEHELTFKLTEDNLLVGKAADETGSKLTLELEYDPKNNTLTGKWHERTSPSGEFGGAIFYGAVQFILSPTLDTAGGKWVGFNSSHSKVNTGDWLLIRKQP